MQIFEFKGNQSGPTLCVLGGVHGDEPCGVEAVSRLVAELHSGACALAAGRLVCVPLVNAAARARNTRFIDRNLNRIFGVTDTSDTEGPLAELLKPYLAQTGYLLDLHSYTAGGPPFVFAEDKPETLAFAACMPAAVSITGFQDCYDKAFPERPAAGMGTTEYARAHGAHAITFECGQHQDPEAANHGYAAIRAALAHTGLVPAAAHAEGSVAGKVAQVPPRHIRMRHVFIKGAEGAFAKPWKHLEPISRGEVYARYADGTVQTAPHDGVVVLPREAVGVGTEWGYLAV